MLPGSFGLLYCTSNHSLTAPFIVVSQAEDRAISDIWPEPWDLPFRIRALGDPRRFLPKDEAKKALPCFQGVGSFTDVFAVGGACAFAPSTIQPKDWEILFTHLASPQ